MLDQQDLKDKKEQRVIKETVGNWETWGSLDYRVTLE
jgi:hypothetical protein